MSDLNVDSMFDQRRKGIPGATFTIGFVIFLIAGVVFGFLAVIRFQSTMNAFDDVRLKWPAAAASLDEQLSAVDAKLADSGANIEPQVIERWKAALDGFREFSQYDRQVLRLDEVLDESQNVHRQSADGNVQVFPLRTDSIDRFVEADQALAKLQSDLLGQICKVLFGLNLSKRVYASL